MKEKKGIMTVQEEIEEDLDESRYILEEIHDERRFA